MTNPIILFISLLCILVLLFPTLDGYMLLTQTNHILQGFADNQPIYHTDIDWCSNLRTNYKLIRHEYLNYLASNELSRFSSIDPVQRHIDTGGIPWNVVILRIYNKNSPNLSKFPITSRLISTVPGCSFAMFSILQPGKILEPHYGPYKGVLRYHLTLITPANTNQCYLTLDNENYYWKEGTDILFDDTYLHSARNLSENTRVVLFLDIKRQFNNTFINWFNSMFLHCAQFNTTVKNIIKNS